jgi:hypothetical protein
MYSIPFIHNLHYYYDSEFIDCDEEYVIVSIYYSLNTLLSVPFIEFLFDNNKFFYITFEPHYVHKNNMDAFKICGEELKQSRYQGYQVHKNNIYMFFRLKEGHKYNTSILYDIIENKHIFDMAFEKKLIDYFKEFYKDFYIYDARTKKLCDDTVKVIYSYIENNNENKAHLDKFNSILFINNKPTINLTNYKSPRQLYMKIRNVYCGKPNIKSYKHLLSYSEK